MADKIKTKSQIEAENVAALLRARNPYIHIVTREEARVERYLVEAAAAAGYVPRTWDVAQGVANLSGTKENIGGTEAMDTLNAIRERAERGTERGAWIMRDLPVWLTAPLFANAQRMVRNLCRLLPGIPRESAQAIIVISPSGDIPAELAAHATVIEWPLPDRNEIADILDSMIKLYDLKDMLKNGARDAAIDAAVGLTGEEAQACYSKSIVQLRTVDPLAVSKEKKRVIARERVLEWCDPIEGGLDAVGGLENLKDWLLTRSTAYSPAAKAYGLPTPKGTLVVGVSGCGKTMICKSIPTAWGIPLLRVDLGAIKSKYVGESEGNLRKVFKVIEAIGRCVVWFDEIEKALQGATSGSADGGVSSDALGAILTWMQERRSEAFVVMTANNVEALPPEFLRKGRFDEIFWVDLPNSVERVEVLKAALKANKRDKAKIDVVKVAAACEIKEAGFTGSEIAAIVPDAMYVAFADGGREITTEDLLNAAATVVPLSKTAGDKIEAQRKWAQGKARPASKAGMVAVEAARPKLRVLDLDA